MKPHQGVNYYNTKDAKKIPRVSKRKGNQKATLNARGQWCNTVLKI